MTTAARQTPLLLQFEQLTSNRPRYECCDKLGACGRCPVALQQGESRKLRDHRRQANAEAARNHQGNQKSYHCIHLMLSENAGAEETSSP